MTLPATRTDFITFCKSLLGDGVIDINVSTTQIGFCVDMAVRKFLEEHSEGAMKVYIPYKVVTADITAKYIDVSNITGYERIINIERVFPLYGGMSVSSMFSVDYQTSLNDLWLLRKSAEMSSFFLFKRNIKLMEDIIAGADQCRFNRYEEKLYLDISWGKLRPNNFIIIECYETLSVDESAGSPRLYSNEWLIKYATALIKKQWGSNMKKYQGVELIGGIKMDGQTIFNEAVSEIKDLEDELTSKWSYPPLFVSG